MILDNDAVRAALPESVLSKMSDGGNEQLIVEWLMRRSADFDALHKFAELAAFVLRNDPTDHDLDGLARKAQHCLRDVTTAAPGG